MTTPSQMLEMREQMLAFDALMAGRFAKECEDLKALIAEFDRRSNIERREHDLAVREEVLAKGKDNLAKREADISRTAAEHDARLDKREADVQEQIKGARELADKAHNEMVEAQRIKADTNKWAKEERDKLQTVARDLDVRAADLDKRAAKLAAAEKAIAQFKQQVGAV